MIPYSPFIPSWLNHAGLSQAEFRVYCALWSFANRKTGIAWPSVDGRDKVTGKPLDTSLVKVCGMARRTVWKTIGSLIERGLVENLGRYKFGTPNRYRVIVPIDANEAPNGDAPIDANEAPSFGANGTPHSAQTRPHECSPKKVHQRKVSASEVSEDGLQFAEWFKSTLPETFKLEVNWQRDFAKVFDDLVRLDHREPKEIREVCQWARTDSFWQNNFMSPSKLRKRNPDKVLYYDVFAHRIKAPVQGRSQPSARDLTSDQVGI